MSSSETIVKKPIQLRIVFILNALMMILPFVFYFIITTKGISIGDLDPMIMIYTGVAYIISFILLVTSILKRNITLFRIVIITNILIALPAKAYIGVLVAIISILLSFHGKVKSFFESTGKMAI